MQKFILFTILSFWTIAWKLPPYYESFRIAKQSERIKSVVIRVNALPHILKQGETLDIVKGDVFQIEGVEARPDIKISAVNFVGYRSLKRKDPLEDRFQPIPTLEINPGYSVARKGKKMVYALVALDGELVRGWAFIRIMEPQIRSIDLQVDGKKMRLQARDKLYLRSRDQLKFGKVDVWPQDVQFRVAKEDSRRYEIIFSYRGYDFTRIPLHVADL